MESRSAAPHPPMAHRSGAHRLWPPADPRPAPPPRGARVAGRDLSAMSGLDPRETGTATAPAAREPGSAPGPSPPWSRWSAPPGCSDYALPLTAVLPGTPVSLRRWWRPSATNRLSGAVPREGVEQHTPRRRASGRCEPRARPAAVGIILWTGTHRSRLTPCRGGPSQPAMPCGAAARLLGRSGRRRPWQAVTAWACAIVPLIRVR
jgi:hypothetical protein